jgi:hypothetical protein
VKQRQVERILEDRIDIPGMAKDLVAAGFILPPTKKIIPAGADFFALKNDVNRMKKLPDGWIRDEFLSLLHRRKVEVSPAELYKHIPWQQGRDYAASLATKGYPLCRMFTVFEWETIKDRTKYNPAVIEAAKILDLKTDDWHWTDEDLTAAAILGNAWVVNLKVGDAGACGKDFDNYVRPVRFSQ